MDNYWVGREVKIKMLDHTRIMDADRDAHHEPTQPILYGRVLAEYPEFYKVVVFDCKGPENSDLYLVVKAAILEITDACEKGREVAEGGSGS